MGRQTYKMSRKRVGAVPLLSNTVPFVDRFARLHCLLIGVTWPEQIDARLLRLQVNCVPFSLLRSELATDVEGTSYVHGLMVERCCVVEYYELIRFNPVSIREVMPSVDVFAGAHNCRIRNPLCATIHEVIRCERLDLILVHAGTSMRDRIPHAFGAERAVTFKHRYLGWTLDVAHAVNHPSEVADMGHRITLCEQLPGGKIEGQRGAVVRMSKEPGMVARDFHARAVGFVWKPKSCPQVGARVEPRQFGQLQIEILKRQYGLISEGFSCSRW